MADLAQPSLEELKARAASGDEGALAPLARALDAAGRSAEATDTLSAAANRGSFEARYLVGSRLLLGLGAPHLPHEGVRLISESVKASADAAHLLAVLSVLGAFVPRNWQKALMFLQLAAERGSPIARRELLLLADDRRAASEIDSGDRQGRWAQLREGVDLLAWTVPPSGETLSESPRIARFDKLLPPKICSWLIEKARARLTRAQTYVGAEPSTSDYRSNTAAEFNLLDSDFITALTQARIAKAADVELSQLEVLTVLHYDVGERFADHFDFVDPRSPNAAADIANLGQRIITFLVYLNEGYVAGETAFPRLGISHKGMTGDALLFQNVGEQGAPDLRTLHAGRAPQSNEKWVVSQFIRSRAIIPGTARPH